MGTFSRDTDLERVAGGRWRGEITHDWDVIGGAPNGGYLMAVGLAALRGDLGPPDALTVTGHYLARCEAGPVEVHTEVLRAGGRHATGVARLVQGGEERVRLTATFGDLGAASGPTHTSDGPPDVPPVDECLGPPEGFELPPIARRFESRLAPDCVGWAVGAPSGTGRMAGWIRFSDDQPTTAAALPLMADALPPAVLNIVGSATWVPTLEMTVQTRARPRDGWLRAVFTTRFLEHGYLEEDGELWDEDDRLVALSRQLALVRT